MSCSSSISHASAIFNQTNFHGGGRVKPGTNTISIVSSDASTNRTESHRKETFPPTNPQQFSWDGNGNLTSDGQKNYSWDEENRLISVESVTSVVKLRSEFAYDSQSRRVSKTDYSGYTNGAYSVTNTTSFIYDGWNLIQERFTSDASPFTNTYVWGQDLSGSLQGAGGIGGLLAVIRSDTNSLQPIILVTTATATLLTT